MWIEKNGKKFKACAYYTDPITGTRHRASVTIEKNTPRARTKAQKELDDKIMKKQSGMQEGMRLSELVACYDRFQKQTVKESTRKRNISCCNQFIEMLEDPKIEKLTAGYVMDKFLQRTSNPTTINEYITRFRALIRWAYRHDYIRDAAFVDKLEKVKDKSKREKVEYKFLEASECSALLEAMTHEEWSNMTRFLLLTGCRIGEAIAIDEKKDIDLINRYITICKTYSPSVGDVTSPKTQTSNRQIYMQDELLDLVRRIIAYNEKNRRIYKIDRTLLFFSPDGDYAHYDAYRKYLAETSERVIGRKITPHTLRHTHASILAETLPLELITRRLGHSSSRITRDIYIHVTERRRSLENDLIRNIKIC